MVEIELSGSDYKGNNGELLKSFLVGRKLLGYQQVDTDKVNGSADNAVALFIGDKEVFETYILRTQNQDYSCYDVWIFETATKEVIRDDKYKAIGEKIIDVVDLSRTKEIQDNWMNENVDNWWLFIKTKSKVLRFGHHHNDCHYPNSLWGEQENV